MIENKMNELKAFKNILFLILSMVKNIRVL